MKGTAAGGSEWRPSRIEVGAFGAGLLESDSDAVLKLGLALGVDTDRCQTAPANHTGLVDLGGSSDQGEGVAIEDPEWLVAYETETVFRQVDHPTEHRVAHRQIAGRDTAAPSLVGGSIESDRSVASR